VSRRLEHLTVLLQREVSHIIMYELNDPRLGFVTVTGLKLAPDQANATIFISVMGDEATQETTIDVIRHARGHIQKLVSERLTLRRTPLLVFKRDDGVKRSVRVSAILHQLAEERASRPGGDESKTDEASNELDSGTNAEQESEEGEP
jgi:ribosome-binding factor A